MKILKHIIPSILLIFLPALMKAEGRIATLYIDTDPYVNEVPDKENYLSATLRLEPGDTSVEAFEGQVSIKGRGNTSWLFPKKPYRLKFDKKQSLAGLPKGKSYVLLSNYIDNTLMRNAVAFKIAELLELPFSNHVIPVDLVFNGKKRGNYMLTNKIGINSASVDIDEETGILWEMDVAFDEEWKFRDATFGLPCMVKDPDFSELSDSPEQLMESWMADLDDAFRNVKAGRWYDAFDAVQLVRYFLLYDLTQTWEPYHPKSVNFYKERQGEKYKMGPPWDFDWSMGYDHTIGTILPHHYGFEFLNTIYSDPEFMSLFEKEFEAFCDNNLDALFTYIDEYADLIRESALADAKIWPAEHLNKEEEADRPRNAGNFDENVEWLKDWFRTRVITIGSSMDFGLGHLSAVGEIMIDEKNLPSEYYDINGIRVDKDNLRPGIYIVKTGNSRSRKIVY